MEAKMKTDKVMEGGRCLSWKEFKETLDNMSGRKILYIDEEGTEIPINTDAEFQEALRLAKRHGNRVRFVLVHGSSVQAKQANRQNSKPKEKPVAKEVKHSKPRVNEEPKEAVYVNDAPPEWFLSYMKMFKKELMTEVNNTIFDIIHMVLKKDMKSHEDKYARDYEWENSNIYYNCPGTQYYYKADNIYEAPGYYVTSHPFSTLGGIRMRPVEKVYFDQTRAEKRAKQFAKMEKARLNALEKRQKQDCCVNVPTIGYEERMRASKSKAYSKVYISYVHDFGPMKSTKSASFTSNLSLKKLEVLQPYALWFLLGNNGCVPWSNNTYVKCFYNPEEFDFEDNIIELPSLEPGVGANVVYEVTPLKVGSFSFTCAIIDNGVEIGERILCRFEVVEEEGNIKAAKAAKVVTPKKETQQPNETYHDEFVKTQKKIKENIKTIMKRLDDIEVLNSESSQKGNLKKKEDDSVKVGQKRNRKKRKEGGTTELRTGVFDLLQNLECIRENEEGKPKDEEKEIVKDTLVAAEDKQADVKEKREKENDDGKKKSQDEGSDANQPTKDENKNEAADIERRDSDSELSVIMGSEEDDNFIVLSMPSRTPSPETEVKELENEKDKEKIKDKEEEKEKQKEQEKPKGKEKEKEAMQKESPREEEKKSPAESNTFDPWNEKKTREIARFDPWNEKKSQPDPFDDGLKDNDKKKMWGFHVVDLPEGGPKMNGSDFCLISSGEASQEIFTKMKNATLINKNGIFVAQDDKSDGNLVYIVDKLGKCVPLVNGAAVDDAETGEQKEKAVTKQLKDKVETKQQPDKAETKQQPDKAETKQQKDKAETKQQKDKVETGKQKENAETKENKEKKGQNSGGASPTASSVGSEQPKENLDSSALPNLLLYNAASDAITRVASAFNHFHTAFLPGVKKTEKMRPIRMMELLGYLEDMGFTDRIRNRELLMIHDLNMPAVIEELLNTDPNMRNNPPSGIFFSKERVLGPF